MRNVYRHNVQGVSSERANLFCLGVLYLEAHAVSRCANVYVRINIEKYVTMLKRGLVKQRQQQQQQPRSHELPE